MKENKELLEVKNLGITFFTDQGALPAVQEVDFKIYEGETLGVVGESGSNEWPSTKSIVRNKQILFGFSKWAKMSQTRLYVSP